MWLLFFSAALLHQLVALAAQDVQCGEARVFANHREARGRGSSRVVGGQPSPEGAWPWLVSLQLLHPGLGFVGHLCGGVLVHSRYVLTAAHCITNEKYALPLAPLWSAEFEGRRRVAVEDIIVHHRYAGFNNDIALVRLARPAPASTPPVCLPRGGQSFLGVRCIASGWSGRPASDAVGLTRRTTLEQYVNKIAAIPRPRDLTRRTSLLEQYVTRSGPPGPRAHAHLAVVSSSSCRALYAAKYNLTLNAGHLCAGSASGQLAGTCLGDSGGPLQCNMADGRWYLAGVTSFGSGCGRPGYPDVYTRLAYYLPWIREQLIAGQNLV